MVGGWYKKSFIFSLGDGTIPREGQVKNVSLSSWTILSLLIAENFTKSTARPYFDIISKPIDMRKHAQSNATLRITRLPSDLLGNSKNKSKIKLILWQVVLRK